MHISEIYFPIIHFKHLLFNKMDNRGSVNIISITANTTLTKHDIGNPMSIPRVRI